MTRPKKVILCVDHNEQDLSVLRLVLETHGYRVMVAESGQSAIASFCNFGHDIDLVLVDFVMPGMSGSQIISEGQRGGKGKGREEGKRRGKGCRQSADQNWPRRSARESMPVRTAGGLTASTGGRLAGRPPCRGKTFGF